MQGANHRAMCLEAVTEFPGLLGALINWLNKRSVAQQRHASQMQSRWPTRRGTANAGGRTVTPTAIVTALVHTPPRDDAAGPLSMGIPSLPFPLPHLLHVLVSFGPPLRTIPLPFLHFPSLAVLLHPRERG